jgi:acyl carrier protein
MKDEELKKVVIKLINEVADEQSIPIDVVEEQHAIVDDLGFRSLDVAVLIAKLEESLHVDPFSTGTSTITDVRTVGDICRVYYESLKEHS